MEDPVQEIDLIGTKANRASAELPRARFARQPSQWVRDSLLAFVFLALGLVLGAALLSSRDTKDQDQQAQATALPSETRTALTQTTTPTARAVLPAIAVPTPTANAVDRDGPESRVSLLDGALELQGSVVLAEFAPFGEPQTVWVIEPGRLIARPDVPLVPGDWPHYVLATDAHIAFTSPPDAYLMPADLSEPATSVISARYIVPGARPGLVWAINDKITTATPIDMITGEPGTEVLLDDQIEWVIAAVSNGFVVTTDSATLGNPSFWAPDRPMQTIDMPSPRQSGIYDAAADIVLVVSPGPEISALDINTGDLSTVPITINSGLVTEACLSPSLRYAVIVGSTQTAAVVDFDSGEVVAEIPITQEVQAVGWTSDTQLVHIVDDSLTAIDLATGVQHQIAQLAPDTFWTVNGSAAMC